MVNFNMNCTMNSVSESMHKDELATVDMRQDRQIYTPLGQLHVECIYVSRH